MEGLEHAFLEAERRYKVNALFLIGLVATESSWGGSSRARRNNNLTGYSVYTSTSRGANFRSEGECILRTASLLNDEYLSNNGLYFKGYSIRDINTNYCHKSGNPDYRWHKIITKIARTKLKLVKDTWIRRNYAKQDNKKTT